MQTAIIFSDGVISGECLILLIMLAQFFLELRKDGRK